MPERKNVTTIGVDKHLKRKIIERYSFTTWDELLARELLNEKWDVKLVQNKIKNKPQPIKKKTVRRLRLVKKSVSK